MAGLYKYFKLQPALPKSSETVTKEANSAIHQVLEERATNTTVTATGRKRKYTHFTPEQRAKIDKYAVQCGNTAATRHFSQELVSYTRQKYSEGLQEAVPRRDKKERRRRRNK